MLIDWSNNDRWILPPARVFDVEGKAYKEISMIDLQECILYYVVRDCWGQPIIDYKKDLVYAGEKVPGPIKIEWL